MLQTSSHVYRTPPSSSSLADVVEIILDKGLVIDAYARVSLVGMELITVDARIVVASVDTYLRYAEAVDRVHLREKSEARTLAGLVPGLDGRDNHQDGSGMTEAVGKVAASKIGSLAKEKGDDLVRNVIGSEDEEDDDNASIIDDFLDKISTEVVKRLSDESDGKKKKKRHDA